MRIIRKVPDLVENFIGPATSLLTDKHHGVLITGVQLATELCIISPAALAHYRKVLAGAGWGWVRVGLGWGGGSRLRWGWGRSVGGGWGWVVLRWEGGVVGWLQQTPTLVRVLKNLVISGYAPEYDVGGITDPFLQIRVLKLLKLVGKGDPDSSDIMSDILAQASPGY